MKLDEQSLSDYLQAQVASARVGPPPVEEIRRVAVTRQRRQRAALTLGVAATVAVIGLAAFRLGTNSEVMHPSGPVGSVQTSASTPPAEIGNLATLDSCPETASQFYGNHSIDIVWVQRDCTTVPAVTGPADDTQPAISHDGLRAALVRYPGAGVAEIVILDRASNATQVALSRVATISGLSWSPDDQFMAFSMEESTGHPSVYLLNLATGEVTSTVASPTGDLMSAWSPDGRRLAWIRSGPRGSSLHIWDRDTQTLSDLPDAPRNLKHPTWLGTGATILTTHRDQVVALDASTGRVQGRSALLGAEIMAMGVSHGRTLVAMLTAHVNEVRLVQLDESLTPTAQGRFRIGIPGL